MNTKRDFRFTSLLPAALVRVLLVAVCALCASAALAANGRDFAGFYRYQLTADFQDRKQVTLTLQIFNFSGAAVNGATVRMDELVGEASGRIAGISINNGASTTVSGMFVIPADEFARWQAGGLPRIAIEYTGADGSSVSRLVELGAGLPLTENLPGGVQ